MNKVLHDLHLDAIVKMHILFLSCLNRIESYDTFCEKYDFNNYAINNIK